MRQETAFQTTKQETTPQQRDWETMFKQRIRMFVASQQKRQSENYEIVALREQCATHMSELLQISK